MNTNKIDQPKTKYAIRWDNGNGHACGTLPTLFDTRADAERYGREWKRDMVSLETTPKERREAREEYQWEVVEVRDVNPSGRAGNSQWGW